MPVSEKSKKKLGSIFQLIRWSSSWRFPPLGGTPEAGHYHRSSGLSASRSSRLSPCRRWRQRKLFFSMSISKSPSVCSMETLSCFWFCLWPLSIIQESIKRIQGRLDWNPTFLYLLEEPFTVYEATELVNLINPGRPIVSNNFLVKFGEFVEEVGVKRVPKKKPRKTYRLKQ